jgi:hypothetical protein
LPFHPKYGKKMWGNENITTTAKSFPRRKLEFYHWRSLWIIK